MRLTIKTHLSPYAPGILLDPDGLGLGGGLADLEGKVLEL